MMPADLVPRVVNVSQKFALVDALWSPRVIAALNDYEVKVARVMGEFVWHSHRDTDELFIVIEGALSIELRDRTIHVGAGELVVIPAGTDHRPFASEECRILLIEPRDVVNVGDAESPLRAPTGQWV